MKIRFFTNDDQPSYYASKALIRQAGPAVLGAGLLMAAALSSFGTFTPAAPTQLNATTELPFLMAQQRTCKICKFRGGGAGRPAERICGTSLDWSRLSARVHSCKPA